MAGPVPFTYFQVDLPQLDIGQAITSKTQLALPDTTGDHEAHTSLTFKGEADDEQFDRYLIRHQMERDVDALWHGNVLRRIIENKEFHAFHHRKDGYLLVETNKVDAKSAIRRLTSQEDAEVVARKTEPLDLARFERIGETSGGYFKNLRIDKVSSASLHGVDVIGSEEWGRYEEAGELSAVRMHGEGPDERVVNFILTKERGIVLFTASTERDNLRFASHVQNLINAELAPKDSP